jgi:hypothetical protein
MSTGGACDSAIPICCSEISTENKGSIVDNVSIGLAIAVRKSTLVLLLSISLVVATATFVTFKLNLGWFESLFCRVLMESVRLWLHVWLRGYVATRSKHPEVIVDLSNTYKYTGVFTAYGQSYRSSLGSIRVSPTCLATPTIRLRLTKHTRLNQAP